MSITHKVKKLVTVLTTSLLTTMTSMEAYSKILISIVALNLKTLIFDTNDFIVGPKAPIFTIGTFLLLERVPYIYYLLRFWKNKNNVRVLINSNSKINIMTLAYL